MSQCTFWCSVLSDSKEFQTFANGYVSQCTFWCSVLSDLDRTKRVKKHAESQCTFWCSVLSDARPAVRDLWIVWSQCTFWCSVLSDSKDTLNDWEAGRVSQCTFWCSVLSDPRPQKTAPQRRLPERNRRRPGKHHIESARTCPIKPHNREIPPQTTPAPPTPPTH